MLSDVTPVSEYFWSANNRSIDPQTLHTISQSQKVFSRASRTSESNLFYDTKQRSPMLRSESVEKQQTKSLKMLLQSGLYIASIEKQNEISIPQKSTARSWSVYKFFQHHDPPFSGKSTVSHLRHMLSAEPPDRETRSMCNKV